MPHAQRAIVHPSARTFAAAYANVSLDGVGYTAFSLFIHNEIIAARLSHDDAVACILAGKRVELVAHHG
jgi:hypothetical protein